MLSQEAPMGAPGPDPVIYLRVPPYLLLEGEELGVAEGDVVVIAGVVDAGLVVTGFEVAGAELAGLVVTGAVVVGVGVLAVPLLQLVMINALISRTASGINSFFILTSNN